MRILAVGLLYPPHYLGGYELICDGVMRAASARGHEVRILTSTYRAPGVVEPDELPVDRALRSYLDASAQRAAPLGPMQRVGLERANGAVMERALRDFAPHVVTWWGMGGMSLSLIERVRRRGFASVLMIQDDWLSYGFQIDGWTRMTRRLRLLAPVLEPALGIPIRYRLERAGRFLFNSEHSLRAAAEAGVEPVDRAVVTVGVHARYLTPAPSEPWRWRLLHVGRLDPAKGIDVAVAALADLPPETTLTIVGGGGEAYTERLSRQAEALGVRERIELLGPVHSDALPALYGAADAVLFPIRWEEPWGLVPLEAMGIGRPVVAVARGGARTYLRDGENSLLIPSEDPRALAAAVRRLAGDGELRARLRTGGARTAAEHTAERHERRVVDELELLAGTAGANRRIPPSPSHP
ncbi:MAG TPA: glycosyltransferase [Solirubrobacteraceae bacterium]|jgi:glycosyltransferase involved in cell wall biosynthesis|nr:glycosyltransferase [Solirubrobacteraceae bacterium]